MSKKRASEETVNAFMKAVYPEYTELCIASNGEEDILRDATDLITELRNRRTPDVAKLLGLLQEARQQIEYLHDKSRQTGSGNAVLASIDAALKEVENKE